MPSRPLLPDSALANTPYSGPVHAWRRQVLRETVARLEGDGRSCYQALALRNIERWRQHANSEAPRVAVLPGDWGEVTLQLTKQHGTIFAVFNMANAYLPGGGYLEGMAAQEENMFRRTDCHLCVDESQLQPDGRLYCAEMTERLQGTGGTVYLERESPRVCIRGAEIVGKLEGYEWLPDDEVFPFYELRAAARDYRHGDAFDVEDARKRIRAQLDTLIQAEQRHVVLGASGCGAFKNPSGSIARVYKEELARDPEAFDCVAFAVFHAGYGPGNYPVFRHVLG